jgi:hypothetical protein
MNLADLWNKINLTIAIPLALGFAALGIFGQLCLDKLPYLIC